MSTQSPQRAPIIRWSTLRGLIAIVLFLIVASSAEYLVVLYSTGIGIEDQTFWQTSGQFPGTNWMITITVSPLFHLVPIAVIIALTLTWVYLTRYAARRPTETFVKREKEIKTEKTKARLSSRVFVFLERKMQLTRATLKGALTVLLAFAALILLVSFLAYPLLIYQATSEALRSNTWLLNCIKSTAEALSPIGKGLSVVNNAFVAAAPAFGNFIFALGSLFGPLTTLDDAGKYLVFQNMAAWIPALAALLYGGFARRGHLFRRGRRI